MFALFSDTDCIDRQWLSVAGTWDLDRQGVVHREMILSLEL